MDNKNLQHQGQENEPPLHELLGSDLVDIYVGPQSTHWSLHEKLLTHYSKLFSSVFEGDDKKKSGKKSHKLPDEDDTPFKTLVGWLYSGDIRAPKNESDIGPLLELYLLSENLQIKKLSLDVVDLVREWYHASSTYPGLRRVQFIYSETDEDNEMREMMVSSIARQLTTSDKIPSHWASALKRNGQLAVDIIRAIQQWNIEERSIPDVRDLSQTRGRHGSGGGFSAIERTTDSVETADTTDTNLGVESLNSGASDAPNPDKDKTDGEGDDQINSALRPPTPRLDPPDKTRQTYGERERVGDGKEGDVDEQDTKNSSPSESLSSDAESDGGEREQEPQDSKSEQKKIPASSAQPENNSEESKPKSTSKSLTLGHGQTGYLRRVFESTTNRAEGLFILSAWLAYFIYNLGAYGQGTASWS